MIKPKSTAEKPDIHHRYLQTVGGEKGKKKEKKEQVLSSVSV